MNAFYGVLLILVCILGNVGSANAKRPNVLIIYADDQGSVDLGSFGTSDLETPNLDRLAGEGLRLTQMYAPAPVCSASRAGLLTGRFPARAGQPGNGPLDANEVTLAEMFQEAGYRTGHVGKWHLGKTADQNPGGQGFEDWFGHLEGCIDNYSHFYFWSGPNRHDLFDNGVEVHRPGEYFPDLMENRCKAFLDVQDDRPWFLYWAFNAPHYPYQGTTKWLEHYAGLESPRREYCAFVSSMDETIGRVMAHLDQLGLREDTIVIFQPDHGHSTEQRAFGGGGNPGPYRGAKFSLFEGGIRVPALVRYPNRFPEGEVRDQFFSACDWMPTLSDLCDVPLPQTESGATVQLDGVVIRDALEKNEPLHRPPYYWQFGRGKEPQWAVRVGPWKLIGNPRDTTAPERQQVNRGILKQKWWLSNLDQDPSEETNFAETHPEKLRQLQQVAAEIRSQLE